MSKPLSPEELAKIKPIPYPTDDEEHNEDDDYAQLTPEQIAKVNAENGGNFVSQMVSDVVTPEKDKDLPPPLPSDDD